MSLTFHPINNGRGGGGSGGGGSGCRQMMIFVNKN